jgi:hypothetical protein
VRNARLGALRQVLGAAIGSFDVRYIPRFARRLSPGEDESIVVIRAWFAHGRFGFQT